MTENPLSYNDAFNARHLSPADVAKDFVAPAPFSQLLGLNHCVLVGPRGSGKTTLLKMLQVEALRVWSSTDTGKHASRIEFVGVFVPADVRWARQLNAFVQGITSRDSQLRLYELAFGTSVLIALLESVEQCMNLANCDQGQDPTISAFSLQRSQEVTLANRLAELWAAPIDIPSLAELKHRLRIRQTKLRNVAYALKEGKSVSELSQVESYISLGWLDILVTGIETINDVIGRPAQRWALLLDELEIVPNILLESIVNCMRSTSSNLIFKLALSPTGSAVLSRAATIDPTQDNDFKILPLWYNQRNDLRLFAAKLLCHALKRRGIDATPSNLPALLGKSNISEDDGKSKHIDIEESGKPEQQLQRVFSELSEKDTSFRDFLQHSEISIDNLDTSDRSTQGPLVRKISPLVQFRNRILKHWSPDGLIQRPGKIGHDPFLGYPNLLDLTEGNPRVILNLVDDLDAESRRKESPISSPSVQSAAITAMHTRFASMLKIYPIASSRSGEVSTLYSFLEALANSIRKRLYHDKFSPDPAQSFKIDVQAIKQYGQLLETCVHLGALMVMNPESSKRVVSHDDSIGLLGARVRLSYRLAPEFFLPLRSTKGVRLTSAISSGTLLSAEQELPGVTAASLVKPSETVPTQIKLF